MNIKPGDRGRRGIDEFMLVRAAIQVLEEMEENGWNQGEVELFPEILKRRIKENSEQLEIRRPFTIPKD